VRKYPQLWFSRLESWSRDVLRLVFQSPDLCLEHMSLGFGLGILVVFFAVCHSIT